MISHTHSFHISYTNIITSLILTLFTIGAIFMVVFSASTHAQQTIQDGDLIRAQGTQDIYIVKTINNKQFKRLIINPDIFNSYGHLEWNNVQDVPASTLNQYKTTNLVRRESDPTIYRIFPDGDGGSKAQITLTAIEYVRAGIDVDSAYTP